MSDQEIPNIPFINSSIIGWFLPPDLRHQHTYTAYKSRAVMLVALVLMMWGPTFGLMYWLILDMVDVALVIIAATLVAALAILMIRVLRSVSLAGHTLCAEILLLMIYLASIEGGIHSGALFWLILLPLQASVYQDDRWSPYIWGGLAVLTVAAFFALDIMGWTFPNAYDPDHLRLLSASSAVSLIFAAQSIFFIRFGIERWLLANVQQEEADKRKAEAALHHSQRQDWLQTRDTLQALVEHSPEGIAITLDGEIIYANPRFHSISGYEEDVVVEKKISDFFKPEDPIFKQGLAGADIGEPSNFQETTLITREGEELAVQVHSFSAVFKQQSVLVVAIRDFSEQQALRAKMMEMDRMLAVGTLAAGVAHEINNPLAFVQGNLEFLLRAMQQDGSPLSDHISREIAREALTDGLEGTRRIRDIVSDLGTFIVREEVAYHPVDLEATLEKAIKMGFNQIRHRARVVRDFQGLPNVETDGSRLIQVFLNLLVNAAQAIPEGGVEDNQITVQTRVKGAEVMVAITDTGRGISEEQMERIFEPFVTSKIEGRGMGLGLSICRNIIQRLDGRIEVESKVGEGSTFTIYLPARLTSDDSAEFSCVMPISSASERRHLVIVDDEATLLRGYRRLLADRFEVKVFTSGSEALEYLRSSPTPDAILCDLQMPGISGIEVFQTLKKESSPCAEVLIFMTGGVFTEDIKVFLETNAHRLLQKPFGLEEVCQLIEEVKSTPSSSNFSLEEPADRDKTPG